MHGVKSDKVIPFSLENMHNCFLFFFQTINKHMELLLLFITWAIKNKNNFYNKKYIVFIISEVQR